MSPRNVSNPPRAFPRRLAAAFLALAAAAVAQALNEANWEWRQAFVLEQPGLVKLALPLDTLDRAAGDLRDLRLVGPSGEEVPFAIIKPFSAPARWQEIRDFTVALKDEATVVTIDAGSAKAWDAVEILTTSGRFMKAAHVESSPDGQTWQSIRRENPLFRQDGANLTVVPLTSAPARWLRLTLDDRRQPPIVITGIQLREPGTREELVEAVDATLESTTEYAGETLLTLGLPAAHLDLEAIELSIASDVFTRQVRTLVREYRDGELSLHPLAQDTVYRLEVGDTRSEKSRVAVGEAIPGREVVLSIQNGDSTPLRVTGAKAHRRVAQLVFHTGAAGSHRLLSGNPHATPARYDLAGLVDQLRRAAPRQPLFQPISRNEQYTRVDPLAGLTFEGAAVDVSQWRQRRSVRLQGTGVHLLELDLAALASTESSLADLRLVRDGKQIPYLIERSPRLRTTELPITPEPEAKRPGVSRWRITLPQADVPLQRLILHTSTPVFERTLQVLERQEYSNGDSQLVPMAGATWRRASGSEAESLSVMISRPRSATLWIEADNGDNPPITLSRVLGAYPVVNLLFPTTSEGDVSLLTGNRAALPPRYDLNLVAGALLSSEKKAATLAAAEKVEAEERKGLPINSALFWAALGAVVIVLLVVVAKMLPKPNSS